MVIAVGHARKVFFCIERKRRTSVLSLTMDLQPLSAAVLTPSLKAILTSNSLDVSQMTNLPFWAPASSRNDMNAKYQAFIAPTYTKPAVPNNQSLAIVSYQFKTLAVSSMTDIKGIADAFRRVGESMFYAQLAAIIGESTDPSTGLRDMTSAQEAVVYKATRGLIDNIASKMPFTTELSCIGTNSYDGTACGSPTDVCDNVECYTRAAGIQSAIWLSNHFKNDTELKDWLFPPAVVDFLVAVALRPWLIIMFASSFVNGPWNQYTVRPNTSFYDSRFAQAIIYTTVYECLRQLITLNANNAGVKNALVARISALNTLIQAKASTESGGSAMLAMYTRIATMSRKNKDTSVSLGATNAKLQKRRGHASSMLENRESERGEMEQTRRRMHAWLLAYIVTTITSLFLIMSGRQNNFIFQASTVLLVVTLYILGKAVRNTLQQLG